MSKWHVIAAVASGAIALAAQEAQEPQPTRPTMPRTSARTYSETVSRDLFTGCDSDGDDRLDLFEANDALDALQDPKNSEAFLKLDTNRDGFLSWPEFDQHYWAVIQLGNSFHVRPSRHLVDQAPELKEARAATPLQRFIGLHDQNGNGALEPNEVDQMVLHTNLPPAIAGALRTLDRDNSGHIDEAELAPWFELLRGLVPEASTKEARLGGGLLPPWQENDADGNGRIDAKELAATLRRLDPSLVRWAEVLLRSMDRNKDGVLDVDELPIQRRVQRVPPSTAKGPATGTATIAGTATK